jgi:hypothetical protein
VLQIFIALKNTSPRPDLNPRPLGPVASTLTTEATKTTLTLCDIHTEYTCRTKDWCITQIDPIKIYSFDSKTFFHVVHIYENTRKKTCELALYLVYEIIGHHGERGSM